MIPFNRPYFSGKEMQYVRQAYEQGHLSGNGYFTRKCQQYFEQRYGFGKCLLTSSCTDALEMAALLCDIQAGDEVIMPSFTFVSTANAFVLRGAKIVFADSHPDHPGIDEDSIELLITSKTKAIVPVHYAGVACDMDKIMALADRYGIFVVEDAAQAIESYFSGKDGKKRPLGSIGHFATFSFHETKNVSCGEGGMLVINDRKFHERAEIIWEKGTNRSAFMRGEVNKYSWVDLGSSFLPSEITAAILWAQLEVMDDILEKRGCHWNRYFDQLAPWANKACIRLPVIPEHATNNNHVFYLVCTSMEQRNLVLKQLRERGVEAVFHYQSLHKSHFYIDKHDGRNLRESDRYSDCLLRLPMYVDLDANKVIDTIMDINP